MASNLRAIIGAIEVFVATTDLIGLDFEMVITTSSNKLLGAKGIATRSKGRY